MNGSKLAILRKDRAHTRALAENIMNESNRSKVLARCNEQEMRLEIRALVEAEMNARSTGEELYSFFNALLNLSSEKQLEESEVLPSHHD